MSTRQTRQSWTRFNVPRKLCSLEESSIYYQDNDGRNLCFMFMSAIGLIKYDLDKQQIIKEYPLTMDDVWHLVFGTIDRERKIIYFMGATRHNHLWSFNIMSEEFRKVCSKEFDASSYHVSAGCWVSSPFDVLHLYHLERGYIRLHLEKGQIIEMEDKDYQKKSPSDGYLGIDHCIERKNPQQLLYFEPYSDEALFVCDLSKPMIWYRHPSKFPLSSNDVHTWRTVFAFDCLLFVFCHQFKGGYVLDLSQGDKPKWERFIVDLSQHVKVNDDIDWIENIILDNQHNIHLINSLTRRNDDALSSCHFRASIFDLIPTSIIKANRKKYDPLIAGFIREIEKKHSHLNVPIYLRMLILNFYPIFV